MVIKLLKHERLAQVLQDKQIFGNIQPISISPQKAVLKFRGVTIKLNVEKLPWRPSVNDVLVAIDHSYANLVRNIVNVGLVLLWNEPFVDERAGGPVYALEAIGHNLTSQGVNVEYSFFSDKKRSSNWHPLFKPIPLKDRRLLNELDFIIFSTAGSGADRKLGKWWSPILRDLQIPFAVQLHDEAEGRLLPYRDEFFNHDLCDFLMPITDETTQFLAGSRNSGELVYPGYMISDWRRHKNTKTSSVVTTCRMTSRKRVIELVNQAKGLVKNGFSLDVHGADVTWTYKRELKALENGDWKYHGTFDRDMLPDILSKAMYHYNVVYLKRGKFIPRVELATYEALQYGCCPILCASTTPDYIRDSMAILVDPNDLSDLPNVLKERKGEFASMSKRFWDTLTKQIDMKKKTKQLIRKIRRAV